MKKQNCGDKKQAFRATRKALLAAGAAGLAAASGSAFAIATGTDLDLSMKAASGGMAGASYTQPQEPSAALFGNPASLTQMKGSQAGISASLIKLDLTNTQTGAGGTNVSKSAATNYVVPDFALTNEISPGLVMGLGIGVGEGIGADYRNSPIRLGAIPGTELPLNVELLSFNANIGLAKQITPATAIGGAVTIGFGLAQLGTAGPAGAAFGSPGFPFAAFGGTTSSVHDTGVGFSFGATHQVMPDLMVSASYKSKLKYNFKNIVHTSVAPAGYQDLKVDQPAQVQLGAAFNINPSWLIEADAVWKQWSKASAYRDAYKDQLLLVLGTQYKTGPWSLRAGYSHAGKLLRDEPNGTLGTLHGLGTVPLPLGGNDLVKIVQSTLLPSIGKHTLTAGFGYDISSRVRIDVFGAYAFNAKVTRGTPNIDAALGLPASAYQASLSVKSVGAGVNFKF